MSKLWSRGSALLLPGRRGFVLALALAAFAGCRGSTGGGEEEEKKSGLPRPDLNLIVQNHLKAIGQAYQIAVEQEKIPVHSAKDLGPDLQRALNSPRDEKPFEIVWGYRGMKDLDPKQPPRDYLLAWEKIGDAQGSRFVLKADFTTITLLSAADFKKAKKVAPKGTGEKKTGARKEKARKNLAQIGTRYQAAAAKRYISGPGDLIDVVRLLNHPDEGGPFEVAWKYHGKKDLSAGEVDSEVLLAWQQNQGEDGGRYVLRADFTTVEYLSSDAFQEAKKFVPKAHKNLVRLGKHYQSAAAKQLVQGPADLGDMGQLLARADEGGPFEVVWKYRGNKDLPAGEEGFAFLLAWQKNQNPDGGRYVLRADFATVDYLSEDAFPQAKKVVPKGK